ncbi:MAG: aminotransferase class I/II-fold pyridoxal phosphate-dependent enzyme [Bulleidia sp.]
MKKITNITEGDLEFQLRRYAESGQIPFHMPGHKRQISSTSAMDFSLDFTEVPGTDDLHHASGILKDAMSRTADLYKSEHSWYLVNGSTCGNLAGIFAMTKEGGEVIAARNCHRSIYHAMQLRNLKVHWIMPAYLPDYEIYGSVSPSDVKEALETFPDSEAVILTSPTYEGVLSDIHAIADIAHRHQIPLFVDEAHGAHLFLKGFPQGAVSAGADIVVQSPHKTLFSATQSAWMHLNGTLVRAEEIEKQLGIFETSSPSYPLMMSLDGCTAMWEAHRKEYSETWLQNIHLFEELTSSLKHIRILQHPASDSHPGIYAFDPSKLLIQTPVTGAEFLTYLHDSYHCTMEMAEGHHVLAMTSAADDPGDLRILAEALNKADEKMKDLNRLDPLPITPPEARMSIHDAIEAEHDTIPLQESPGRTAGEYLFLYPPGIPLIVPGEVISEDQLSLLSEKAEEGCEIRSSESETGLIKTCR